MLHAGVDSFVILSADPLYSTEKQGQIVDNNNKDHARSIYINKDRTTSSQKNHD